MNSLVIKAELQKDGVYPLEITTGQNGKIFGLPGMLTISPGAPFYYRLDGGAPQFSDSSNDLVLGPIQPKLGMGTVRLVAYSTTGKQTFSAHLDLIDLTGALIPASRLARRLPRQRRLSVPLLLILTALLASSCVGLEISGTVGSQVKITKLTYKGGKEPVTWTYGTPIAGDPVWAFDQGTATYQLNVLFTTSVTQPGTNAVTKETTTCPRCSCVGPCTLECRCSERTG